MAKLLIAYPNNQTVVEAEETADEIVARMNEAQVVTVTVLQRDASTDEVQSRAVTHYNRAMVLLVEGGPAPSPKK